MDESTGGQEFQAPQQEKKQAPAGRWRPGRRARWGGAVAVTVLIAGGAVAAAAHHGFEEHEDRTSAQADGRGHGHTRADRADGHGDGHKDGRKDGHKDGHEGAKNEDDRRADDPGAHLAPAPLPSLDAADAVVKASSAVPGGKVESLHPVSATGGGRAWQAVVLGPDGVRHEVTVDGATFAITSNTVTGG
ncbi:hypothetical protein ACFZCK_02465 [Kitasatospora purpeofusca]|uniref:hypothetical protein n=1 Tax=Kitasatospora purpeofusca TaxID=67352 RepID=UPI0036E29821